VPAELGGDEAWEQFFWSVFETSTNPLMLLDEQRLVLEVNDAACELFGVSREEFVGTTADVLSTPAELSTVEAEWERFGHDEPWSGVRTLISASGDPVRVQYAVRPAEIGGRRVAVSVCLRVEAENDANLEEPPPVQAGELTTREREIVSFVALGSTDAQIAEHLRLTDDTVRTHLRNAMAKTGARTQAQLVATAFADRHIIGGD
jgi:PAS domain S-box-containing protein